MTKVILEGVTATSVEVDDGHVEVRCWNRTFHGSLRCVGPVPEHVALDAAWKQVAEQMSAFLRGKHERGIFDGKAAQA